MITITSMVNNMNGFFQLKRSEERLSKAAEQVSSWPRLNSTKNEPASLSTPSKMSSAIRERNQSIRHINDEVSLSQVADNALNNAGGMLERIRELALQLGDASLSADNQQTVQEEISQLAEQLNNIGKNTRFNGVSVFDHSAFNHSDQTNLSIQIGFNHSISLDFNQLTPIENTDGDNKLSDNDNGHRNGINSLIANIDHALAQINDSRSRIGANQTSIEQALEQFSTQIMQTEQWRSQINRAQINNAPINNAEQAQSIADFLQARLANQANSSIFIKKQSNERDYINTLLEPN